MRKITSVAVVAVVTSVGFSAQASAAPSNPPNCFGQSAAGLATSAPGAVGELASSSAAFFKATGGSIGQTGVPELKETCQP
ncbi:MAG TPA: hypothetical protein VNT03_12830 [Baekduia sp.]|nr:hypothetical protein [Baekduia sp.]